MKLGGQRPGSLTMFVDSSRDEVLLRILVDEHSCYLLSYTIYDSQGRLVADSQEPQAYPAGLSVKAPDDDELLLDIPSAADGDLVYRLYNHNGLLLTSSDGKKTQIFGYLRMEGKSVGHWKPKTASIEAVATGSEPAVVVVPEVR